MHVLALNIGSSSLKYALFAGASRPLAEGTVTAAHDATTDALAAAVQRATATAAAVPDAIGHRVVHGADRHVSPALIDAGVERDIEELSCLAPHHNPAALALIRSARRHWPDRPHVAVFDTAFHATLPPHASAYAVPREWRAAGLRRYGFHGLSHEHVMEAVAAELSVPAAALRIVSCHLGNGASACAIDRGRSVDTSMGLTPLEGLIMGTRCGDLDPGAHAFVARRLGVDVERFDRALHEGSGLAALSGVGADLRDVESAAASGDRQAALALDAYAWRVRKYIGAYAAAMGGCDVVAFTGGVGENASRMRERICDGLRFLGVELDAALNRHPLRNACMSIGTPGARTQLMVVRADEQSMIARAVRRFLTATPPPAEAHGGAASHPETR